MSTKFKTVITTAGAAKLAAATAPGGRKVNITTMAVGDGGGKLPVPDAGQTGLIHEVWRHALNKITLDKRNSNYIIAELVIPPEVGGFWMRELGLYDDAGTLIAVANMAESYKPALAEGSGRSQTCRMVIIVSTVASVELTIDTTTVMATQDYVDDKIAEHEQSRRHPDASLTAKGFTQLSSATNSTSETLAATPKAVKAAYDLANGKYTAQDATTARKGLVQLSSATNSMSETLAATPKAVKTVMDETNKKAPLNSPALTGTPTTPTARQGTNNTQIANTAFVMAAIAALVDSSPDALNTLNELAAALGNDPNFATTMTNALAGKQPKDATLTALAGLATAADRFPYFTGNDVASLATLTKVGRDILAKSTVAAVIEYLGLQETVNRAGNAVQKNGDTLSGGLTFENDSILAWIRNTDWAKIGFKNDADGDTDSYMWFETGDNGNEYFKWRSRQSTTTKDLMTLKWDALNILVNAVINGCFGVGTTNALGGSSIVLGDNDTGFKQNGDGILDVYANSQRVFRFQNGVAIAFKNIQAGDSKKFSLSSSNTSTKNITFNLWGASTRPVVAELGDEAGWHFYSQRNTDNSVIFAVNGQMQPSNWGNFDSRYVKDVRLGTRVVQLMARGGRYEKAGHTITGLRIIGEVDGDDEAIFRPIQKYINGTWYNVAQV
ncbi:phage tail protein [Salmonella enterica subsp. enterica serovar Montevideo]|uniref:Phage tail protein n=3 Tax=Enterobacteriaceae TaxID=543 RepID=A0A627MJG0_SALMO|nr:phage tail protein [Escherichia coli]ATT67678.1 phage tail protein [Salmonella enterica subsp. enterica serovar Montevideo str. USDA-ARS-USMARC-1901]AYJ61213.1 phage tail protein [Salmonella enterica subsp. enterica serovar Montevideo]EAA9681154.1 phage tail protein [Salmonella enterica]EAM1504657.1 phage tail protein [Salmonella enterica subsp. enterica]EDH7466651.1 phage tail protein [Salmonella enterica subsp. enterica serovar Infantis]EDO4853325.1 phage tail protein [Salmonella enteric